MTIQTVGVIGAGQMGNGIAHVFALAGYDVLLTDVSEEALKKALATVAKNLDRQVKGGKITLTVGSNRDEWRGSAEKKLRQELENHVEKSITVEIAGSGPDGTSSTPPKQEAAVPMIPNKKPERPSAAEDIEKIPKKNTNQ